MTVQLYSIVVYGTLRILDRGPNSVVSLRAVCITVKPGGRVLAGESDRPYSGVLEFLLTGDGLTESHQCGGTKPGMKWNVEANATVELYGEKPHGRLWGSAQLGVGWQRTSRVGGR